MSTPSPIGRLRSSCHVAPLSSVRNSPACGDVAGIANIRPGCEVDAISAAPSLSGPTGRHVAAAAPSSSNDVWPSSVTPDWARAVAVTWYVPAGTFSRHQPVWSNVAVDVVTRRSGPVTVTVGAPARSGSAWMNTVPPAGVGSGTACSSSGRTASRYGTVSVGAPMTDARSQPVRSVPPVGRAPLSVRCTLSLLPAATRPLVGVTSTCAPVPDALRCTVCAVPVTFVSVTVAVACSDDPPRSARPRLAIRSLGSTGN